MLAFHPGRPDNGPRLRWVKEGSDLANAQNTFHASDLGDPEYLKHENYLRSPPTAHFRGICSRLLDCRSEVTHEYVDSLRSDRKYLTSWLSAGWTNDVITIGNLIYLAQITSRIPVVPPFTSHIGGANIPISFSEIFDVPRLAHALKMPILEWQDIKNVTLSENLGERDELGCWNIWEVDNVPADGPRGSYTTGLLNLDISYTRAPQWVKLMPGFVHDSHSRFWSLARLAFPESRETNLKDPVSHPTLPSEHHGVVLPPDEQLLCYDYLYYVAGDTPFEIEYDYSPVWRFVAKHFRWTQSLEELAGDIMRRTMSVPKGKAVPPFITVHARRGDFVDWCNGVPEEECFAPLSAFARRVQEVQDELRAVHGIEASHVIMTSDEKDEGWWDAVKEMGWLTIDHERTVQVHGRWYPVILDAVIQSRGMGFVGTDRSTFSVMARRRVSEWNGGAVRTVKWGHPDADAH
ncbi:uncharacterized protein LAESUDRAFT_648242 [Laetiporus sulphureus 93-53]|uniref:Uncharacterized protein n=1 Tax=Laetiporus sulphureus 93-53 TaxID=1314785 RepID=A0A165FF99_9APHY|nr:uncharacterized protein LAESUDRAFT_648242 [Laetiporus sulphureus 93-53]KZT08882.1 hypothetical protein LAESUDRAFT_648242 [Laetiporus sulphureus 93-53]